MGANDVTVRVTDADLLFATQTFVVIVVTVLPQACGDLNSDGAVNAVALVELTPVRQIVEDLSQDGAINVLDTTMILQLVVGSAGSVSLRRGDLTDSRPMTAGWREA